MTRPTFTPALSGLLGDWLPRQRWFPVKSPAFSFEPAGGLNLAGPGDGTGEAGLQVLMLAVNYQTPDGSRTDVVQVPLSIRTAPLAGAEAALIGQISGSGLADGAAGAPDDRWVYDGVHDPAFISAWLELMRDGGTTEAGNATGHLVDSGYRLPRANGFVKVLSGEQSNTSVIVDDGESAAILKFFRVLSEGQNPEVEIGAALTAGRAAEVPATLGWVSGEWARPSGRPGAGPALGELAVAHEFLAGGLDAWRLAVDAAAGGRDFTAEAHALGAATATVHRRLAEALGVAVESGPGRDIAPGVAERVRQSWAQAGSAVGPYDDALDRLLGGSSKAAAPGPCNGSTAISTWARSCRFRAAEAGHRAGPSSISRVSRSGRFPNAISRTSRYATSWACCAPSTTPPARQSASTRTPTSRETWVDDCAEAFLAGYAEVIPGSIDRDSPLFVALWLDKALYEVIYELRNRPDWLSIPVNASRRLLGSTGSGVPAEAAAEGTNMTGSARIDRPGSPLPVDADTLARVAAGEHHAPHSVLGAHLDDHGHVTIRTVKHLAEAVSVVTAGRHLPDDARVGRRLGCRAGAAGARPRARLPAGSDLSRARRRSRPTTPTGTCPRSAKSTCT